MLQKGILRNFLLYPVDSEKVTASPLCRIFDLMDLKLPNGSSVFVKHRFILTLNSDIKSGSSFCRHDPIFLSFFFFLNRHMHMWHVKCVYLLTEYYIRHVHLPKDSFMKIGNLIRKCQ